MSNLNRFDSARIATLILVLILSTSIVKVPGQIRDFLIPVLPMIRLWPDPDEQYRRSLSPVPYDLLRVADTTLPRDATVLLVTSADDIKYDEYLTYHRALFFLTPRPVWWLSVAFCVDLRPVHSA